MRQIKQPVEIDAIKKAIEITNHGLERAKEYIHEGVNGFQLKAEMDYEFTKLGATHGFSPIITTGPNTCLHHLQVNKRILKSGEPILFDIGAEHEYYTADVSRTYFFPQPTKRQKAVYDAVYRVQKVAENLVKPGVLWKGYALKVEELMGEELARLGLIADNNRKEIRKYFSHGIGHSLGLDAHDPCDYTGAFEENMIITIEPGIYIPEEGFGVRIEDDYLVDKSGVSNLSAHISYS